MKTTNHQLQILSYGALFAAYQSALGDEAERSQRVADAAAELFEGGMYPWYQQSLVSVADELRELRERRALTNALLKELVERTALGVSRGVA